MKSEAWKKNSKKELLKEHCIGVIRLIWISFFTVHYFFSLVCVCVSDAKCHVRIPNMETQIPIFIVHDGKESFTQLIGTEMEIKKKFKSRLTSEKKKRSDEAF